MRHIILASLVAFSLSSLAAESKKSTARSPAGVTTPDNYSNPKVITLLDGGNLYSGSISFEVDGNRYAIPLEKNGALSPFNQRIYDTVMKVIAREIILTQVHTFDGQIVAAGDFTYKVVAAINVSSR